MSTPMEGPRRWLRLARAASRVRTSPFEGLVIVAVLALPALAGYGIHHYVSAAHRALDLHLQLADGTRDPVTALAWEPNGEDRLLVGTQAGRGLTLDASGNLVSAAPLEAAVVAWGAGTAVNPSTPLSTWRQPFPILLNRQPPTGEVPSGALGQGVGYGTETCLSGTVWREARDGDTVCVTVESRARALEERARLEQQQKPSQATSPSAEPACPTRLVARGAFPGDQACVSERIQGETREENRVDQTRKVLPDAARAGSSREVKFGTGITASGGLLAVSGNFAIAGRTLQVLPPIPVAQQAAPPVSPATETGLIQYDLSEDPPVEVGQVFGIGDVRVVKNLPGSSEVIAGDAQGQLVLIGNSQQISGVNPTQYVSPFGRHDAAITAIATAENGNPANPRAVTAAADGSLKAWLMTDEGGTRPIDIAPSGRQWLQVHAIEDQSWQKLEAMSADGRSLAVTLNGGTLAIVAINLLPDSLDQYQVTLRPTGLTAPVAFAPGSDNNRIAAYNPQAVSVEIGDTPYTQEVQAIGAVLQPPRAIGFNPDGTVFATVSADGGITLRNLASRTNLPAPALPDGAIARSLAFNRDGSLLAVVLEDGTLSLNRVSDGAALPVDLAFPSGFRLQNIRFSDNGKELLLFDPNAGTLLRYGLRAQKFLGLTAPQGIGPTSLSANGGRYLSLPGQGAIAIRDAKTGTELGRISTSLNLRGAVYNRDASRIAVLDESGMTTIFDEQPDLAKNGPMPPLADDGLRLSADGSTLLFREPGGKLHMAAITGTDTQRFPLEPLTTPFPVMLAEIAPDGSFIAAASADGRIALLDRTGALIHEIVGHGDLVQAMALSPSGAYLASASFDGRLRITDLARARFIAGLPFSSLSSASAGRRMTARYLETGTSLPAATDNPPQLQAQ